MIKTRRILVPLILCFASLCLYCNCEEMTKSKSVTNMKSFEGYRAFSIRPDELWCRSNCVLTNCILQQKGIEIVEGEANESFSASSLSGYDLVVINGKRSFTSKQVTALKDYLNSGGAVYGNWGGPAGCPNLLAFCGAKSTKIVQVKELTLADGPLSKGIGNKHLPFPVWVGERGGGKGFEMVSFTVTDGVSVGQDAEGQCMGFFKEHGKGRSAILGFVPENYKFLTQNKEISDLIEDNLLSWLLPNPPKKIHSPWTNKLEINLPRRCKVQSVSVNGIEVGEPELKTVGSLKTLSLPVGTIKDNETADIRISYTPFAKARNIQTTIFNPAGEFITAFDSPFQFGEFLSRIGATDFGVTLRHASSVWYIPCITGDQPNKKVAEYKGDYLSDCIAECHKRGVKFTASLYLTWVRTETINKDAPLRIAKNGKPAEKNKRGSQPVCFLAPAVMQRNIEVVRHFLNQYPQIDAFMLDDNFEFDQYPCYCEQCKIRFRAYCEQKGVAYNDPSKEIQDTKLWMKFWKDETKTLLSKVREMCKSHGKPFGAFRSLAVDDISSNFLDFHCMMVYSIPISAAQSGIASMPERLDCLTLLWGMDRKPEDIQTDTIEAIQVKSRFLGFWLEFSKDENDNANWGLAGKRRKTNNPNLWDISPGTLDTIAKSFANVEERWLSFYKDNLIGGDRRFVVLSADMKTDAITLKVKNTGNSVKQRIHGPVDISVLKLDTKDSK